MFDGLLTVLGSSVARAPWGWGVLIVLVTIFARLRPLMTKLAQERETSLLAARAEDNAELKDRVAALEARLDSERVKHDAERAIDRHRINNLTACLDALLMMLELAPDKAADHVAKIKEMRERQAGHEAAERSAIQAATINATVKPV